MLIIFDLDGTLINTIDDLGQACNHALKACGFPTHEIADYPLLVGNGINRLIERALPEQHRDEETVLRLREYFVPYYDIHNCDLTHPYEGIPKTFDVVLGERVGVARKPDPQIVYDIVEAIRRLGDKAMDKEILYIGDSLVDAETAKAAGATLVLCTWGFCTKEQLTNANPNYIINHPSELIDLL